MNSVQQFETMGDFFPPFQAEDETPLYLINFILTVDGPSVSARSYVERFLATISKGTISLGDDIALGLGVGGPGPFGANKRTDDVSILPPKYHFSRSINSPLPADVLNRYRDLLDAVIEKPTRVTAVVCMELASKIKGKIIKVPRPVLTKGGFKIEDRVAVFHRSVALAYAYLLLLSNNKGDLCKCTYCGSYFLAESKGRGRTSRTFCSRQHRLKHQSETGAERASAARAGVPWKEWREIRALNPGITPGKWDKLEKKRARMRKK